ncbi:MAG: 50S ribosomal protein L19 [Deltaproteobacteria bacterium]|nr:50S ribosomal protein L19 [Deltaproteobacteria bacterium]
MDVLKEVGMESRRQDLPEIRYGDTVRVFVKIVEEAISKKDKPRVRPQMFEGTVIRRKNAGAASTFTVRKVSYGVGVERVFPLFSPRIEKIEIVKHNKVRRARLYYLRTLRGKAARLREVRIDSEQAE